MRIAVVGIIRNSQRHIETEIQQLHRLLSPIGDVEVYVVESDSDDETVTVLDRIRSHNSWFSYDTLGRLRDTIPERTPRLARCRNQCVEQLRGRQLTEADRVIVSDLDRVNNRLTTASIADALELTEWDAITANQAGPYYDIWTLRHPVLSANDYQRCVELYMSFGMRFSTAVARSLYSRMVTIPSDLDPIEVDSAFGGFAIYRPWVFNECRYSGRDLEGNEVCEHVPFNEAIRANGGRICIAPRLINAAKTEHTSVARVARAAARRALKSRRSGQR